MAVNTELWDLIKNGNKSVVVLDFINRNQHNLGQVDDAFVTACQKNMKQVAEKLLPHVENPDHVDINGYTALVYSLDNKMDDISIKLIDKNCTLHEYMLTRIFLNPIRKQLQMCILNHFNNPNVTYNLSILEELCYNMTEEQKQEFPNICPVHTDIYIPVNADAHRFTNETKKRKRNDLNATQVIQADIATRVPNGFEGIVLDPSRYSLLPKRRGGSRKRKTNKTVKRRKYKKTNKTSKKN